MDRISHGGPRCALSLCLLASMLASGCSRGSSAPEKAKASARPATPAAQSAETRPVDPATIPLPDFSTAVVQIYTPDPGFRVFVDGEPVRTEAGEFAATPCAVVVPPGNREIVVAKDGFADTSRRLNVTGDTDGVFEASDLQPGEETLSAAAHLDAPLGKSIALTALNSPGAELDPYVSPDGLSIWFVGQRSEGTGIFVARRASPYHQFEAPRYVFVTGGLEVPATPSLTGDGLTLVYAVPEKQRIYAWTRATSESEFTEDRILQFGRDAGMLWPSCQILPDALRLYWTERPASGGSLKGKAAVRRSPAESFSRPIGYPLPGLHPCLSADGLRQYVFDGKRLQRARRADLRDEFSALETIATVELPNYVPSNSRRQYFVSDDEQWLFYSDDPDGGGDLHMARLFPGRHWGVKLVGTPIAPRKEIAATAPAVEPAMTVEPKRTETEPESPRTPAPVEWQAVGSRRWESPSASEYAAAPGYSPESFLRSSRELGSFELKLEWKAEGTFGQGGVFFRYPGQGDPYARAFKIQLANDYGLLPDPQCTGSLFNYQAPDENAVHKPGEWNSLVLLVRGDSVEATINGKKVLETLAVDEQIPSRGYIALDGVVGGITYRNIQLNELPDE